ncbi:MAG TPA: prepilin-type N-terminal cleavage/methylation domain-containing protein [Patescibacteria group bacterium]|nr:prepilin-type N-terminal cleavage/methylation domain-containing protein [Patescibacteria group bacterium]
MQNLFRPRQGFTLIELLIVIGILTVVLTMVILAISPLEQFKKTQDVGSKAIAQDFINSSVDYYTTNKKLPWSDDPACSDELATTGKALSDIPSCTHDLIKNSKLEDNFGSESELKDMYITKCGQSAVICYNPKSKVEYDEGEATYDKFGVNDPGCPGHGGPSPECYWCKPVIADPDCLVSPTPTPTLNPTKMPTPTMTPTATPTSTPMPTLTPTPTNTPTPTLTPTPTATPTPKPSDTPTPTPTNTPTPTPDPNVVYGVGGYKLDDTKFLKTYAVLSFNYPSFGPNYMVDVSFRSDFGGTTWSGFGYQVGNNYVVANADTIFNVAYAGDGNFGTLTSPSYAAQIKLTQKHFSYISVPYYWVQYAAGCGKTIYWRVVGWPGDSTGLIGPTYTGTVDCTTKVGVVSDWLDMNHDGVIDWTDYIIEALQSKLRYGGWQPPE